MNQKRKGSLCVRELKEVTVGDEGTRVCHKR